MITNIKVFPCGILNCSLEVVEFECTFNRNHSERPLNKTSSNKEDQINQQDIDGENRSCIGNFLFFAIYDKKHEIVWL